MKIKVVKPRKATEVADMIAEWKARYGTINSLQQKVQIGKCTSPGLMTDYVLWKYLSEGAEFQDVIVLKDPEVFDALSARRVELLEYLLNNDVKSIRNLATALRRNYKNVYDDLLALSRYGLVDLSPKGRSLRPTAASARIEVSFES